MLKRTLKVTNGQKPVKQSWGEYFETKLLYWLLKRVYKRSPDGFYDPYGINEKIGICVEFVKAE